MYTGTAYLVSTQARQHQQLRAACGAPPPPVPHPASKPKRAGPVVHSWQSIKQQSMTTWFVPAPLTPVLSPSPVALAVAGL